MSEDKPKMINLLLADNVGISEVGVLDGNGPTGEGIRRVDSDGHSSGTDQRGGRCPGKYLRSNSQRRRGNGTDLRNFNGETEP
jgi:hypothetical protein